jgi:hypothetical protein
LVQEEIVHKIIHNSEIPRRGPLGPRRLVPALAAALGMLGVLGCHKEDEVTQTTVAQPGAPAGAQAAAPGAPMAMPPGTNPHAGMPGMPPGSMPPGAMPPGAMPGGQLPTPPRPAGTGALKWTAPKGWTEQPASGMRFATLIPPGAGKVEMSVVVLPGAAGGELANVNRWRSQIGLPPIDEAALGLARKVVQSKAGAVAVYDFTSTGDVKSRMVTGLLAAPDGNTWFLKLMGDAGPVGKAKPAFLKFLETLHLG